MISFQFNNAAFNKEYNACELDVIISGKSTYGDPRLFFAEVINLLDSEIYPECGIHADYDGFRLKEGLYLSIIEQRLNSMNQKIDVKLEDVIRTYRIKRPVFNPLCDEFIIETSHEYIAILWSVTE